MHRGVGPFAVGEASRALALARRLWFLALRFAEHDPGSAEAVSGRGPRDRADVGRDQ